MSDEQKKEFYSYFNSKMPLHLMEEAWEEAEVKVEEGFIGSGGMVTYAMKVLIEKFEVHMKEVERESILFMPLKASRSV